MMNYSWLEFKHNVLNRMFDQPQAPFVTYTVTTIKKRPRKRYPSRKGYGRKA